ncbi:MAG TPA: glycosyltransferase family 39 protein, partial [Candidatus Acidoferrum sp.]
MAQTILSSPNDRVPSLFSRAAWTLLILATLYFCYFHNLGLVGFVGPDEPRYAWIARGMAETGDWITPRLYGQPWFEKPVLYYWGAALSFRLFGISEAAARLPSAISALLATLAMGWLAWSVYGAETARWLLLFLPTTVGMIGFSHAAATDMPFAGALTVAMVCAAAILGLARHEDTTADTKMVPQTPWRALCLFGFSLGLAVLAKGPAAIILAGGAVLLWAVLTRRWRDALRCLHPMAIASFCLTALPWYILCARRNPDFFRIFIIEHNFKRYLTPEFQHIQPFWFYIPVVLVAFFPWTLLLLWSAVRGALLLWQERHASARTVFWLAWPGFCLLFFSASRSKLPGYILPAVPAISLLLARVFVTLSARKQKTFRWQLLGSGVFTLLVSLAQLWMGRLFSASRTNAQAMIAVGLSLLLVALAYLLLAARGSAAKMALDPAALCVAPVLVLLLMSPSLSRPWLRHDPSGKTLAAEILATRIPPDRLYAVRMKRGQQYSL